MGDAVTLVTSLIFLLTVGVGFLLLAGYFLTFTVVVILARVGRLLAALVVAIPGILGRAAAVDGNRALVSGSRMNHGARSGTDP